ncbi:ABC transporter permease [Saccharicrinis aurantiacus]|uniref:ABC transporter permease n=1 Tax=Saccharicrinis aurantiacus TaxID=1849719 RepID=UPI000838971E|nr:ABC transporter permease [Saccharicrinis aurantiacus]
MDKILLVLQREYLTRVKKKSFIIMTALGPLLFAAMMVVPGWLMSMDDKKDKVVAVDDATGFYQDALKSDQNITYKFLVHNDATDKNAVVTQEIYDALLVIEGDLLQNPSQLRLYSDGQITMDVTNNIKNQLNNFLRDKKLESYDIEGIKEKITEVNQIHVNIDTVRLDEDGSEKRNSAEFAMVIGMVSALLIYLFMLIYGTQVMRGVIEEKTNRIVEVIISSVKPFQLMMGKIVGIGLVALTQFLLWVGLTVAIVFVMQAFVFGGGDAIAMQQAGIDAGSNPEVQSKFNDIMGIIGDLNIASLFGFFLFYFIGGYLIYSTLFAAIGSAIDNETETQQFVMPVMIPIILSFYVAMAAMQNPHGDLAFWFSMIPLTSPVVMMARIPFDVPAWEIILSMFIMMVSFVFFTWFAGRVYRTGILMYGKKVSYKEIWKWFIQAGK